jgi:dolichyl-phosphate-mannose-protein mannosyltransferase
VELVDAGPFYTVAYLPFVVIALAMTLGSMLGPVTASPNRRAVGASMVGAVLIAVVLSAWFFYPIWTAEVIPYAQWQMRMWFPTWV